MAGTQTGKTRSTTRKAPPLPPKAAAAAKATTPKPAPARKKPAAKSATPVTDTAQWRERVAMAAYLRAEARGFIGGSAEQDWFEAEAELMAELGNGKAAK